ncbi:MAG TPA: protein phosphatase 2C domain-containing protein [Geobacteraceae bacterium]|nr:protein phosphatase 2C domain-containing protein [Geobacteraceae bacterium]
MKIAVKSDTGLVRENNEDAVLADPEKGIFLLADGMGGHAGGEVASKLAVRTAHDFLCSRISSVADEELPRLLAEALAAAHSAVNRRGHEEDRLAGMGTTLEILAVRKRWAVICHLGDSRVYLFRQDSLAQFTVDDNAAAWLKDYQGVKDEVVLRAARHILTQAVGVSDELVPEIRTVELQLEDLFLLCSDGLTEMLSDREIADIIRRGKDDLDTLAAALVDGANGAGGHDNVSVLLVAPEAIPSDLANS